MKPFLLSPLITKISIVHFHQIENWVPKKLPNSIHLNPKNMRDIHPRKVPVALLQFFHLLFITNSSTRQYSINYITNKNDNKNDNKNSIAASLTTYYFSYDNLQMSFQPLDLFKILIVIVIISIGVLRRSFVNT